MPTRQQTLQFFAVTDEDGLEHVLHAVDGYEPPNGRPITDEEARRINADLTARSPSPVAAQIVAQAAPASPAQDLQPILAQIEALRNTVVSHAELHDQHQAKQVETDNKFDAQAKDISNVKVTTAKAISAALDGLGEKPA